MAQKLDANLNVIQETPIELELINGDLNIISVLDDEPNDVGGLTSSELKAKFDEAGNTIKNYINNSLVPAVLAADATEATRSAAEAERVANEVERVNNEASRVTAEQARAAAEEYRLGDEAQRQQKEDARRSAEATRQENEFDRNTAEARRQQAEQAREDLETGYVAQALAAAQRAEKAAAEAESVAGGESDVFIATFDETTQAEVKAAYDAGKAIFATNYNGDIWSLVKYQSASGTFIFSGNRAKAYVVWMLKSSGWSEGESGTFATTADLENIPTESDVFIAKYGVTSFADIEAAYNAGKAVFVSAGTSISPLVLFGGSEARFNSFQDTTGKHRAFVNDLYEGWSLSIMGSFPASHASTHAAGGADELYSCGTADLEAGVTELETGKLYFVYE